MAYLSRYIFITHSTGKYMETCAEICAPISKVCSIVQGQAKMYGTEFMAKSLSLIWCECRIALSSTGRTELSTRIKANTNTMSFGPSNWFNARGAS
ncbi:hypothetical protein BJX64DRAFT_251003 [Aspergillus heterothallicus]